MADSDVKTFDEHEYLESILRYSPNADHFRMFRDSVRGEHLAVGFGGGTYLFSALTERPGFYAINYSQKQLDNGILAGPKLVRLFGRYMMNGSLDMKTVSAQFPEVSAMKTEDAKKIVRDIELMSGVILERERQPTVKEVLGVCGYFQKNTGFEPKQFDSLDVSDLLPHVARRDVPGIFYEIKRVLKPGGVAVITYFPSSEGCMTKHECADKKFLDLAERFQVNHLMVYDEEFNVVHPGAIGARLQVLDSPDYPGLMRKYWLDLKDFHLQDPPWVRKLCRDNDLLVRNEKFVPGGMLDTARYCIVVEA